MAGSPPLPPISFSLEEAETLVLGARWVADHADPVAAEAARKALDRIMRALTPNHAEAMRGIALFVGPQADVDFDDMDADPAPLHAAIQDERRIALFYEDGAGEVTERVIWPFAMAVFDRTDVLLGWCELRGDYRTFRIDRIVAARVLLDRYPRPRAVLLSEWPQADGVPHERFRLIESDAGER
jgi:predicted DNA-binding transcriptional regulator YafY